MKIAERYADAGLGLADAALVALAERIGTISFRGSAGVWPTRAGHRDHGEALCDS